ncbi:MAG TPA: hypothetical protein ENJ01_11175 [Gammaproteobacteria bacterium]|nr:hypothetical protein [Gammaproteobacteria bacterium]
MGVWTAACYAGLLGFSLLRGMPALAAPADGEPALLPASAGLRGTTDPLRIRVPGLTDAAQARYLVELDNLDVSNIVAREDDVLVLTPVQPLAPGKHSLRLVENTPDGEIIELAYWTLEVRQSAWFREADGAVDASLSAMGRVATVGVDPEPDATQSEGVAQLRGSLADGRWSAEASVDVIHHSNAAQLPRGRGIADAGDFLATVTRGEAQLALGHHEPVFDSLIVQELRRRGASAAWGGADSRVRVAAFALRTQEVAGFQEGLGIGDADNRIRGLTLSAYPFAASPQALHLSASVITGNDPGQEGEGVGGESGPVTEGRAMAVAADSQWLDERLRLRAEVAQTRFDFDGVGGNPTERDDAATALLTYMPLEDGVIGGESARLLLGLERRRLGTFFRSIGDPAAVADRDLLRAFGEFSWAGWDVQTGLGEETDNVNDLPLLPRIRSRQASLSLTYTPPEPDDEGAATPWYGAPSYSFSYVDFSQDVERAGAGLTTGAYRSTDTWSLAASFTYAWGSWGVSHTRGSENDFSGTGASTDNAMSEASLAYDTEGGLSLGLNVQRSVTEDRSAGVETITETLGMDIACPLRENLEGTLSAAWNREQSSDDSLALRTLDLTGALQWRVREARPGRPGLSLLVDWQHQRQRDAVDPSADITSNQIFFRLTLNWVAEQ